jgi:hypothetical protein
VARIQSPGWFPDPAGEPIQRYWDGTQWTKDTRPFPPPVKPESRIESGEVPSAAPIMSARLEPDRGSRSSSGPAVWVAIAVLLGIALLGGGYALNRMQIDERAREAARQGANIGGTSNSLRDVTNLLCPQGSNTPPKPGVDCSRADLFK